jgi:hypothetical protein
MEYAEPSKTGELTGSESMSVLRNQSRGSSELTKSGFAPVLIACHSKQFGFIEYSLIVGNIRAQVQGFQGAERHSGKLTQYCEIVRKCFLRNQVVYSRAGNLGNHILYAGLAHKCM